MKFKFANGSEITSLSYITESKLSTPRSFPLFPGDKLWAENYMNAKEIEKELNNLNIPCRIGQNCESGEWSVAIL